jgi:hypothetical protein
MQTKKIEAYNLGDFVKGVQESAKEGFEIDFDDNDSYPVSMVGYYRCLMHKGQKVAALLKEKVEVTLTNNSSSDFIQKEDMTKDGNKKISYTFGQEQGVEEAPKGDFKPSVVFVAEEPIKTQKPRGRPVSRGV